MRNWAKSQDEVIVSKHHNVRGAQLCQNEVPNAKLRHYGIINIEL